MELVKQWKTCGGLLRRYTHASTATATPMTFSVFTPPARAGAPAAPAPVLFWLSGLTCTDENFAQKAGAAFHAAAAEGVALVLPDTSPRGAAAAAVPGAAEAWDFGIGAGFYVDATAAPWSAHWRMHTYVTEELPALLQAQLGGELALARCAIAGHSMGGLGALMCALRRPGQYVSASALAPIAHPSASPRGQKAFSRYLGEAPGGGASAAWAQHDPTALVASYAGPPLHLKVTCGAADEFYVGKQLLPEDFVAAAQGAGVPVDFALVEGYDHSFFLCVGGGRGCASPFIASLSSLPP